MEADFRIVMRIQDVSVLVVDDVNSMRVHIKELLRLHGFQYVKIAPSPQEAKMMLELEPFHLILSDWQMNPTDGIELLMYVREHPEYKDVAFIMLTAENTKEKVIEAIKLGVDDYVVKPLTPEQVQKKILGLLRKKQVVA